MADPGGAYEPIFEPHHMGGSPWFVGHQGRECGEHRTVGPHRAWCFDCAEWCYPDAPCIRCEAPFLRAAATPGAGESRG